MGRNGVLCPRILQGLLILEICSSGEAAGGCILLGFTSWRFFLSFLCGMGGRGGSARKESEVNASGEPGLECLAGWKSLRVRGSGSREFTCQLQEPGRELFCLSHLKAVCSPHTCAGWASTAPWGCDTSHVSDCSAAESFWGHLFLRCDKTLPL